MSNRVDEINTRCDELYQIVCSLVMLKKDIEYFYMASDSIKSRVFSKFRIISRIQNMTYRNLIILIYSLIKQNEPQSFDNLLKLVKKEKNMYNTEWKNIEYDIGKLKEDNRTGKIFNLRNKFYAHVAIDRHLTDVSISYSDVVSYTVEVQNIYVKIYEQIKGGELMLEMLDDTADRFIYKALYSYNQLWDIYEEYELTRDKSLINPDSIRSILFEK